ncbi:MAG: 4-hydroxy-tetrahydrodipicolinate synthase [Lentisphaeria bacterium]|nr:4-hydroxy-tetrahydrodipicolinate synthase [Lentisphaeria bacterium]
MKIQGLYTALVTPFRNGAVDYDRLTKLVEMQISYGVDGISPVGTTGESPTLSFEEHERVIATVVQLVNGRCKVLAGSGANSTAEALHLTRHAKADGADFSLQVAPYYNKPTQEGLYRHFATIADSCDIPIVIYNVPGRSGVSVSAETIARLAKNHNVAGVKEASGSVDRVSEILDLCDIPVLSGDDALTVPMMSVGAVGVVSVASNIIPKEMKQLVDLCSAGAFDQARAMHRKLYKFFKAMFVETNPIPVKAGMAIRGLLDEEYRLPLCPPSDKNREFLRQILADVPVD